jgi:acyl transferase domain-containing protein/acyl carrier protein
MAGSQNSDILPHDPEPHGDGKRVEPDAAAIQAWLLAKLSRVLGIEAQELDVREPFASYGLGSTELVSLSGELSEWLGRLLPAELAYECPTIETLARHLAQTADAEQSGIIGGRDSGASAEPIAIIGIGCRFPGAIDADAFWELLRNGVDAIREVPAERFNVEAFFDPDPAAPGKMNTRWGGFIEDVDQFDAHFFGISPREAARMDPQQRLLLEVAVQALEDAGQVGQELAGTPTGVFIGISNNDYGRIQLNDYRRIDAYAGTGNALSIAANRISYVFDFHGPSIALDTACSSSLVAVHAACNSLRRGECTLALAGGVNLILSPAVTINFTKAGAMAPDGRCKTFDARANGYVRGEGAGIVVLKPLTKARADGDPIYAVIRGSAVNQDGRSNGLMAPNPRAQEAVLRDAYLRAAVSPCDVQYVEAHGTGTFLGDPIEAKALGAVVGVNRDPGRPCAVGSVKTNVGHLEAAAGIAGLIKVALALKHREIPPSLNFHEPNPHIPFDQIGLRVPTTLEAWPTQAVARLAGVSSFGFGGTNAHVVLQGAPEPNSGITAADSGCEDPRSDIRDADSAFLLPLSARDPTALRALARSYQNLLTPSQPRAPLYDICYSASTRRSHYDYRLAVTGNSAEQLSESLEAYLREEAHPGLSSGKKDPSQRRKLVFVFPGQGSQWFGMARQLLQQEGVFRESVEACDAAMRPYGDWSLIEQLTAVDPARSRLNEIDILQPALFAIQVSLAVLWRSWGVEPDAVVGHSMGEVAAAHVAGALSLEDAVRIICCRSGVIKSAVGQGAMAAVALSIGDARRALVGYEDRVSIGASNSHSSTVLSGDKSALEAILDRLRVQDIFCQMAKVDFAAHSPQMDPLRADLLHALDGLNPRPALIPIYSTVTGIAPMTAADGCDFKFDADYWVRNLREPVLFSTAIERLIEDRHDIFLEISPHPILLGSIRQELNRTGRPGAVLPSMRREEHERALMLGSLGALYTLGRGPAWSSVYQLGGRCVRLPFYPWQHERCWLEGAPTNSDAQLEGVALDGTGFHRLLGRHFKSPHLTGTHFWETTLDKKAMPFLDDHRIEGALVLPASFYLEMALAAAVEAFGAEPFVMKDVEFHKALFIHESATPIVQVILSPGTDGASQFHIYGWRGEVPHSVGEAAPSGAVWTLYSSGNIRPEQRGSITKESAHIDLDEFRATSAESMSGQDYYLKLRESGIDYGPFFRMINQLWRHGADVLGQLHAMDSPDDECKNDLIQPAILDACIQIVGAAVPAEAGGNGDRNIYVPTHIAQIRIDARPGSHLWTHAHLQERDAAKIKGEVRLLDEAGHVAVEMLGLQLKNISAGTNRVSQENLDDWLYEFQWQAIERHNRAGQESWEVESRANWLIFVDRGGVGEALGRLVTANGGGSILVTPGESYERTEGQHFRINPERPDDLRQLFEAVFAPDQPICEAVVHLWSLDAGPPADTTVASLEAAQTFGCGSALQLVQQLARIEGEQLPQLWLITRGAQSAGEETLPFDVAQAPLWGLGRVIAQEHPPFWGGLIDLEPGGSLREDAARQLLAEITAGAGEDQIAFRRGRRYAGRLVRKSRSAPQTNRAGWRTDGSYLITGGLGDLGLVVARWMVEQGARRLILLGRTKLPPRAQWSSAEAGSRVARQTAAIREIEAAGASVHLAAVDVANEAQLSAFLHDYSAEGWPPIRGVVHAAGVLQDGLLVQLDAAALGSVLRPKIIGGWLLHRLLADAPLDFFVMFSSAGSLLGQPGQGNYAAGNAFLDALAHHRRALGRPALSINWGAWSGLGFADTPGGKRLATRLALLGIGSIAPQRALEVLGKLLSQDSPQVAVVPVDWEQYRQFSPAGIESPLLSDLAGEKAGDISRLDRGGEMRKTLLASASGDRQRLIESHLTGLVARVLGLSVPNLDVRQPLSNLGLDSLMAVELKNRIAMDLGVNVPIVTFLSGPSVEEAAAQLLHLLTSETSIASKPLVPIAVHRRAEQPVGGIDEYRLENLDQYSDEEVNSLLVDLLANEEVSE